MLIFKIIYPNYGSPNKLCTKFEFIEKKDFPNSVLEHAHRILSNKRGESTYSIFKGTVIQIKGQGLSKTFTIRKMSGTFGVERIFQ